MTEQEKGLLLTTARILRASRSEASDHYSGEDVTALNEALAPFDPIKDADPDNGHDDPHVHASDCAVHNGPALPVGPCDCL